MDLFKKCNQFVEYIDSVKEQGMYPYFHSLTSGQDTEVVMSGIKTVMIGSNNYLGLTNHPEVINAGVEALKKYGSGCSGSRFLNGTLDLHIELEQKLSKFLKKESVLTFSTGFQTNLGIISAITDRHDVIVGDRENHASIVDGCRLSFAKLIKYKHNDMEELEIILKNIPEDKGVLIITDGVFSMSGDIANLPDIVKLAKKYGARIMVDDAHAFGVIGKHGRGTAEYFGLEDDIDIYMGTFSKSLASLGGYCASSRKVIDYIKHKSRPFIFSASITPASVACAIKSLDILEREPQRMKNLRDVSNHMRKLLKEYGIKIIEAETPIISIPTYNDDNTFLACKLLLERGVYVNPVISPAVDEGYQMLRTSYTATHTLEQMEYAALQIKDVLELLGILER
ncbi:MAG TPA: pyridoxal phosphate-dependent aminotransferase family protein [Acholeplasmataceae bacterium]|nr:pyridoxal phosphate-dependent aminotransferase family protein [Acholeplasmataceae bacterium]